MISVDLVWTIAIIGISLLLSCLGTVLSLGGLPRASLLAETRDHRLQTLVVVSLVDLANTFYKRVGRPRVSFESVAKVPIHIPDRWTFRQIILSILTLNFCVGAGFFAYLLVSQPAPPLLVGIIFLALLLYFALIVGEHYALLDYARHKYFNLGSEYESGEDMETDPADLLPEWARDPKREAIRKKIAQMSDEEFLSVLEASAAGNPYAERLLKTAKERLQDNSN